MNAEELSAVAGICLSVRCSYFPGVNGQFNRLDPTWKRLVMLGLLVLASVGVFVLSFLQAGFSLIVYCSREGTVDGKHRLWDWYGHSGWRWWPIRRRFPSVRKKRKAISSKL